MSGGSGPVFSKLMTTPLWTFCTRDSRHWFNILCVRTQYDRPERKTQGAIIIYINDGVDTGPMCGFQSKKNCRTSSDFTHLGDGGLVCGDAAELLRVRRGCSRQPQHQRKQTLVPAEGLLGQLAARQRGVQRQVQLRNRKKDKCNGRGVLFAQFKPFMLLHRSHDCKQHAAFVCALTSSGTPELCVSLFPSVIVMITDGSRKKGLRPWDGNSNIKQLSSSKHWPHWLYPASFLWLLSRAYRDGKVRF